jgi:hypothetical protein
MTIVFPLEIEFIYFTIVQNHTPKRKFTLNMIYVFRHLMAL